MHTQVKIGKTSYQVPAIGLGGMPLSIQGRPEHQQALRVIQHAVELGVRFIDTADVYCLDDSDIGHNERLIQQALAELGDIKGLVIATKGGLKRPGGEWVVEASPQQLRKACEASLKALKVEQIQLYQLHAPDQHVPLHASIEALAELQQEGKIKYLGLSNVSLQQIQEAESIIEVTSVQNRCNIGALDSIKNGIIEYCTQQQITFIPYSPVGGRFGKQQLMQHAHLLKLAEQYSATTYQIALAWLLSLSPMMLAIPGATRKESIDSSWQSLQLDVARADLMSLNQSLGIAND